MTQQAIMPLPTSPPQLYPKPPDICFGRIHLDFIAIAECAITPCSAGLLTAQDVCSTMLAAVSWTGTAANRPVFKRTSINKQYFRDLPNPRPESSILPLAQVVALNKRCSGET